MTTTDRPANDVLWVMNAHTPATVACDGTLPEHRICAQCDGLWPCDAAILAAEVERLRAVLYAAERVYNCYYNDSVVGTPVVEYTPAFLDSIMSLRIAMTQHSDDTTRED